MSTFTYSLLANDPLIPGLDESIVIAPRRLHLTLGVMSLEDSSGRSSVSVAAESAEDAEYGCCPPHISPTAHHYLENQPLRVPLEVLDTMRPHRDGERNAHNMSVGPDETHESEENRRLRAVCGAYFCRIPSSKTTKTETLQSSSTPRSFKSAFSRKNTGR